MSLHIGHESCYQVLDNILRAYESGGRYTRLVQYAPGESVLMDSKPAPGYVPGVLGKKETGLDYVPQADGTRLHIFYIAKEKADKRAIAEASRAIRSGFDNREIMGSLVSIKRNPNSSIQMQFVASNRDTIDKHGHITSKLAIRSVSVTADGSENSGLIIALGLDQSLGIPYHQLAQLAGSAELVGRSSSEAATIISRGARAILDGQGAVAPEIPVARPRRVA